MRLEAGKFYRDHDCKKIGPMQHETGDGNDYFFIRHEAGTWNPDGSSYIPTYGRKALVAEWIEEETAEWPLDAPQPADLVNHPPHYMNHPSGVECIQITEHMNFCRGNAVKYIWRADDKGDVIENLEKAKWYLEREIARLKSNSA